MELDKIKKVECGQAFLWQPLEGGWQCYKCRHLFTDAHVDQHCQSPVVFFQIKPGIRDDKKTFFGLHDSLIDDELRKKIKQGVYPFIKRIPPLEAPQTPIPPIKNTKVEEKTISGFAALGLIMSGKAKFADDD